MKFVNGILNTLTTFADVRSLIASAIGKFDSSYNECDDCPTSDTPTSWWMLYQDFSMGLNGWNVQFGTYSGNGVLTANNGGTSRAIVRFLDFGGDFALRAAGLISQRRGSDGNGTSDTTRLAGWSAANATGTERLVGSIGFITCNLNDCNNQFVLASNTLVCRSFSAQINVTGAPVVPTNFGKELKAVVYGACNAGNVKPVDAVYVSSVPSVGNLFP